MWLKLTKVVSCSPVRYLIVLVPRICNENCVVYNRSVYGDLKVCGKSSLCVAFNIPTLVYHPV